MQARCSQRKRRSHSTPAWRSRWQRSCYASSPSATALARQTCRGSCAATAKASTLTPLLPAAALRATNALSSAQLALVIEHAVGSLLCHAHAACLWHPSAGRTTHAALALPLPSAALSQLVCRHLCISAGSSLITTFIVSQVCHAHGAVWQSYSTALTAACVLQECFLCAVPRGGRRDPCGLEWDNC